MTTSQPRLVLLPGMGADGRLFGPQRPAFPQLEAPAWLDPEPGETLVSYGRRMAAAIGDEGPLYLGGVSLGGMVALEAARHLRPHALLLIGSCRSGRSVPAYLRYLERVSRLVPDRLFAASGLLSPLVAAKLGALDGPARRLVADMMREIDVGFLRWAGRAILGWTFDADLPCPIHQIHGDADRILPLDTVDADRVVHGAGHLLNLTHPDAVNAFILSHMQPHEPICPGPLPIGS